MGVSDLNMGKSIFFLNSYLLCMLFGMWSIMYSLTLLTSAHCTILADIEGGRGPGPDFLLSKYQLWAEDTKSQQVNGGRSYPKNFHF